MARKTIRVNIPKSKPDGLIKLGQAVLDQHDELGKDSPLDADEMKALQDSLTAADASNKEFKKFDGKAQAARQARDLELGTEQGNGVNGTVVAGVTYARNQLLIAHKGHEEKLEEYGFDVVVGTAKSPVRKNGNGSNGQPK